jgi:arylsulfatase A-like enzyme
MDLMKNDRDTALLFKSRFVDSSLDGFLYSLLFPSLLREDDYHPPPEIVARFPRGLPTASRRGHFLLEDAIDWVMQQSTNKPQPYLQYYHFLPPHSPYRTREDFIDTFMDDSYQSPDKPLHPVVIPKEFMTREEELLKRRYYDEFLLYVDSEFNRLIEGLDRSGVLDNTLLVFTSDHGEMFERGSKEHIDPYLFDPLVKIPLIIFEPGQTQRRDIHTPTSCVDLLPTLLDYTGHEIPDSLPGQILPPFGKPSSDQPRTIYAMDARLNSNYSHLNTATLMMRRDNLKVIRYSGYADYYRVNKRKNLDLMQIKSEIYYEVFDLEHDPEELTNLAANPSPEIQTLIEELEQFYRENVEFPEI